MAENLFKKHNINKGRNLFKEHGLAKAEQQPIKEDEDQSTFLKIAEPALSVGTSMVAEPVSGLAGLSALPFKGEDAGDVTRSVRDFLTYSPRTPEGQQGLKNVASFIEPLSNLIMEAERISGDAGYDIGGPILGAITSALPAAAMEAIGLAAPSLASKLSKSKALKHGSRSADATQEADNIRQGFLSQDPDKLPDVADTMKDVKHPEIAEVAAIDPDYLQAVDDLGIASDPLASFASQNPQFRSIEQALSAIPGSMLDEQAKAFIGELSTRADDIISRYGGNVDKAGVSQTFRDQSIATIDDLEIQASRLYDQIDDSIPKTTKVKANNTVSLIESKAKQLNGFDKLPSFMKKIYKDLKTKEGALEFSYEHGPRKTEIDPTIELLSQRRREVGEALNKKSGPFKDSSKGLLKLVYSKMRKDQDLIAKDHGLESLSKTADKLIVKRKDIEKNLTNALGKDLSGSLMPKVGQSLKNLSKGQVQKYDDLMKSIPEQYRTEVAVSSLNDIFRGSGVNQQAMNVTQYSKFMDELSRNPTAKRSFFKYLPEESHKPLEDLHKVAKGISIAQQDKVRTGVVLSLFDEDSGFIRKMLGKSVRTAAGYTTAKATGSPILGAAVSDFLSQKTKVSRSAAELLSSDKFKRLMIDSARDGVIEGGKVSRKLKQAEKELAKSVKYRKWADALDDNQKLKLADVGLVGYLLGEDE